MAREARKLSPVGLYIVSLGGEKIFIDDEDRRAFKETAEKFFSDGGAVYGYFLGENRAEMVVKEGSRGISLIMKSITISYARYFNKAHSTNGKLFTGRFKSTPLESEAETDSAIKSLGSSDDAVKPEAKPVKKSAKTAAVKKQSASRAKVSAKTVSEPVEKSAKAVKKAPAKTVKKTVSKTEKANPVETVEKPVKKKRSNQLPSWLL